MIWSHVTLALVRSSRPGPHSSPQPPERSLPTPGPPQRTSNLKRAHRRGILWCSQASPSSGGPYRPLISPRRAAHRPARHSPRAAHRARLRLHRRSRRLMSKVRCRWGYPTAVPSVPKTPRVVWVGSQNSNRLSLLSLSLASVPLQTKSFKFEADPSQPIMPDARKTRSPCNSLCCTPFPATALATSDVAPVSSVPSVVRTLRLSLLHSH